MKHLIEITDDIRAFDKLLDDADGDLTGQEQIVDEWAAENKENFEEKVDNYAALITEKMRTYQVRQGEAERLTRLALTDKSRADWLKGMLKHVFDELGVKKLDTDRYRISVAKNGGKRKLDIHVPDYELPAIYKNAVPPSFVVDKEKIREDLEAGRKIHGAVLQECGTSLRIR
jgi:hypothetical protein